jgi:DNA modification methylase
MSNSKIMEKLEDFGPLTSPRNDLNTPIYNWHSFKHSYSRGLVDKLINELNLGCGSWVLDPYVGGETTLLACKELGINSLGFDILPFSVFLSNVKTSDYNVDKLRQQLKNFEIDSELSSPSIELPDIEFINKAFNTKVKIKLRALKEKIDKINSKEERDFFTLGLLSTLESVSNTTKAGGFLRIVNRKVTPDDVYPKFLARIYQMIEDVESFYNGQRFFKVKVCAQTADSRKLTTKKKFDAVITSPPYPNRHDYTRIYGLEIIFNFVKSNNELKEIRYNTLRSHVEARKRFSSNGYKKPPIIDELINQVTEAGLNNSKVPEMIEGYFEDMYISISQMQKRLKPNGKIGLVVSNVRFGGVNIPVDEILAEIGEQTGLTTENIFIARYRGNSSQQMKNYKRKPSRESAIVWENN